MKNSDSFIVKDSYIAIQTAMAPLLYLCAVVAQFGARGIYPIGEPVDIVEKCEFYILLFADLVLLNKTIRIDLDGITVSRCLGVIKRTYRYEEFECGYIEYKDDDWISIYLSKEPVYRKGAKGKLIAKRPYVIFPPYYGLYQILNRLTNGLTWNLFPPEILSEENLTVTRTIRRNRMIYYAIHIAILSCYVAVSVFTLYSERFFYLNAAIIFGLMFLYRLFLKKLNALESEYFLLCLKRLEAMEDEQAAPHNT